MARVPTVRIQMPGAGASTVHVAAYLLATVCPAGERSATWSFSDPSTLICSPLMLTVYASVSRFSRPVVSTMTLAASHGVDSPSGYTAVTVQLCSPAVDGRWVKLRVDASTGASLTLVPLQYMLQPLRPIAVASGMDRWYVTSSTIRAYPSADTWRRAKNFALAGTLQLSSVHATGTAQLMSPPSGQGMKSSGSVGLAVVA